MKLKNLDLDQINRFAASLGRPILTKAQAVKMFEDQVARDNATHIEPETITLVDLNKKPDNGRQR